MTRYYATDLDGTLAHHSPGDTVEKIGAPVPRMVARVKKWLADGHEVRVVTARVAPEWSDCDAQVAMIEAWCLEHVGVLLPVQAHKCGGLIELWDDRGVGVVRNTGLTARDYDEQFAIESDAYAHFDHMCFGNYPICIDTITRNGEVYVGIREARVLAARLLRAADEAEAGGRRTT